MKKIEATSTAIFYLTNFINKEIVGGYINNIQLINYDILKIKINKNGAKQLLITKECFFLSDYIVPVISPTAFIKYLKKKLYNKKIINIKQDKNNRIIYIEFYEYYLIFEFFSSSNIILTDKEWKIISARKYESWKDKTVKRNEVYKFSKNKDPKEHSLESIFKDFKENIKEINKKNVISFFVKRYNIHPIYFENIKNFKDIKQIIINIKKIYEFKNPEIYVIKRDKEIITCKDCENKIKNDFFELLNKLYLTKNIISKKKIENKKINKIKNIIKIQKKTKEKFLKDINKLNLEGAFIYSNFNIIDNINKQIRIATKKKIDKNEIKNKINNYFKQAKINLKIKEIDLKEKEYTLESK